MHLLITDSGVGGLSVCAYIERFLRTHHIDEPVRLTYVNASPENDFGYNAMGSRDEKVANFDRFLHIVKKNFEPDLIYIACNTLSVLFPDTDFATKQSVPVRGIVETGVTRLLHDLQQTSDALAILFGTVTTIAERTCSKLLQKNEIESNRIISQACPSLADTISEDRTGSLAWEKINRYVNEALGKSRREFKHYLAYLACTHYGYRKELFIRAFAEKGVAVTILNPNELVIDDLFSGEKRMLNAKMAENTIPVQFITRYKIPETALETISYFLEDISPATVAAFLNYTHRPDLF